ncbi:MAG: APC family permease [Thermoprotei archaeon]|nr:MAG: APC family permease [Thermoprotei archaeon]
MSKEKVGLKRVLRFWQVFGACFGLVVCSTTLWIVSLGYAVTGSSFIISQFIALCIMIFTALSMSELATTWPRAGSFGVFVREAFGHEAGMWIALMYFLMFFPLAVEALIVGEIAHIFIPTLPSQAWAVIFATIMLIVNLLGISIVGWVALLMTIYMIGTMVVLSIAGLAGLGAVSFDYTRLTGVIGGADLSIILAMAMLAFWLYVGWEVPAPLAEETKNPERTIPLASISALFVIFAVQAIFGFAVLGLIPQDKLIATAEGTYLTPHIDFGFATFGPVGGAIVATVSIIATLSTFNAVMAGSSRLLWSLGWDGYLPKVGWLHPRFRTPWIPLLMEYIVIVCFILWLMPYAELMVLVDTFFFLVIYLMLHASVVALRIKKPDINRPFKAGGPRRIPIVPVLGIIGILLTMYYQFFDPTVGNIYVLYYGGAAALLALIFSIVVCRTYAKNKLRATR